MTTTITDVPALGSAPTSPPRPPASRPPASRPRRLRGSAIVALAAALSTVPAAAAADQIGPTGQPTRTVAAATPAATVAPRPDSPARVTYGWPTGAEAAVLRPFDAPAQVWLPGHRGVDLLSAPGAPVRAAADGVVAFAGSVAGRPLISVDHADGIRTTYEPVTATVTAGTPVRRGDAIGTLATDPRLDAATAPDPDSSLAAHGSGVLHWGARIGKDAYVDPLSLLRPVVIRLLPL